MTPVTSLTIDRAESLEAVSATEWDRLAAGAPLFLTHRWLSIVERDASARPVYILARGGDGALLAAMPLYYVSTGAAVDPAYDFSKLVPVDAASRAAAYPAVLLGARHGYKNEHLVASSVSGAERAVVVNELIEEAVAVGNERGARAFAAMYVTSAGSEELALALPTAVRVFVSAHARLEIDQSWSTFDDYVQSMSSSRRSMVRRDLRRFAGARYEMRQYQLADVHGRLAPLLANLQERYGSERNVEAAARFLADRAEAIADHATAYVCEASGRPIGFSTLYEHDDGLYVGALGFDYDRRKPNDGAYFMLTYYLAIEHAIARGYPVVHLGVGSFHAKVLRGAVLEPLWGFVVPTAENPPDWRDHARRRSRTRHDAFRTMLSAFPAAFPAPAWPDVHDEAPVARSQPNA